MTTGAILTVVIPALNAAHVLGDQLLALEAQDVADSFPIIIVDNGSSDHTADVAISFARRSGHRIRLVTETRRGINHARNAGIDAAQTEFVALCDADDLVSPNWYSAFATNVGRGLVCAGLVQDVRVQLDGSLTPMRDPRCTFPFGRNRVPSPFGGNCAFSKVDWATAGRFAPELSGPGDEAEFFLRMAATVGVRFVEVPEAKLLHRRFPQTPSPKRRFKAALHKAKVEAMSIDVGSGGAVRPRMLRGLGSLLKNSPALLGKAETRKEWLSTLASLSGSFIGWGSTILQQHWLHRR